MVVDFFKEEFLFLLIALFVFTIATFVATREFVDLNPKRFLPIFAVILLIGLIAHYSWRKAHIQEIAKAFEAGKRIECIDKTTKLGGIVIKKGEWRLEGDTFKNPAYYRSYNIRHCIVAN